MEGLMHLLTALRAWLEPIAADKPESAAAEESFTGC
jgi:hypothetical protein